VGRHADRGIEDVARNGRCQWGGGCLICPALVKRVNPPPHWLGTVGIVRYPGSVEGCLDRDMWWVSK
jgi:hypothetical protein